MLLQFVSAIISVLGFTYIFNVRGKVAIASGVVGGVGWIIYLFIMKLGFSLGFSYFILGAFATFGSEIIARVYKVPVILALIPIITPIVPGSGAYYTMFYLFAGNHNLSLQKATDTLVMTGAMMLGFLIVSDIFKIYIKFYNRKK